MEKEQLNLAVKLHMLFVIPIVIVNLVGIFSKSLYEGIFVFFIISILNVVMIASILLQILKPTAMNKNRKVSIINLVIILVFALGTFFRYLFLLAT